jgi:hypothetical protein
MRFKVWQKCGKVWQKFFFLKIVRISECMNDYVYQIQGALENAIGEFKGLRVVVCDLNNLEIVDAPSEILDKDTCKFLQFRLQLTEDAINIQNLPVVVQNKIRVPLGKWLDRWVLKNFYGDISY